MKQTFITCGAMLIAFNLCAESKPRAEAHFRVTDDLPKLHLEATTWYCGVFSVSNTGDVAFVIVTDKMLFCEAARFYREGTEEQQRVEEGLGRAGPRREAERKKAENEYYYCLEEKVPTKTLQPGQSISFECDCFFRMQFGTPVGVYKAEMYLGHGTWIPVHITPTLGTLFPVEMDKKGTSMGDFYYSPEGTSQYLYVKTGDGKFKRAGEMKLGSNPKKEGEDAVTFESPDGTKKKLTRERARQIIHEQRNQQKE